MKLTVGIIGCGNMGSAIISGIRKSYKVLVSEVDLKRVKVLRNKFGLTVKSVEDVVSQSNVIILAVKPQDFDAMLEQIRFSITKDHLVISIAAGITCQYIEKRLGKNIRVVRTMPNLPAQIGQSMTGICLGKYSAKKDLTIAQGIFNCIGATVVVDESRMNAITAVSGSGPAYVFLFIECFENAARSLGLDEKFIRVLVSQTLEGSLNLLKSQKESAAELRVRVTSKGGTTQAALDVFNKYKIEQVFKTALAAAAKRAKELSKD